MLHHNHVWIHDMPLFPGVILVNFHILVFQALVLESASLKYKLRRDGRHLEAFLRSLYQSFKCCVSALTSYTHHLPFCTSPDAQVWSLSRFKVSCQLITFDLNRISSVSLLMTASTALANEGLFELTLRPSLTLAVSLS